jgi:hypothetical protein
MKSIENLTNGRYATELGDVIAVEVFDDKSQLRWNRRLRATTGPWCIGRPDDVIAEMERLGYEDYDVVVRAVYPRTRQEKRAVIEEFALG